MIVKGGATDVSCFFSMKLAATGADATGLTIADFDMQYTRIGETSAAKVDAVALAAANTAHTDNRGIEVDPTDQPGLYRFDWPDAAFAAGVREVGLSIKHASCFTEHRSIEIDPLGAPAGATLAADIAAVKVDTAAILDDTGTSGVVLANDAISAAKVAAGAFTSADFAAGAFDAVWSVAARTLTAGTNIQLPSNGLANITAWTVAITGNITGNLSGSVGSVTGAVGSVSAIAANAITAAATAADFGTEIGTAVWATTTRLLTAGTNIVLAKGTGVTGFNDLSAAQVNAEADTALSDYDPPTRTEATSDKAEILTAVGDVPTNAELTAALASADDAVLAAIAALNNVSLAQITSEIAAGDDATLAAIAALNNLSAAQVATEIADALGTDTYAEPTGVPSTTATIAAKLGLLHMALVNGIAITATKKQFKDAAGNVEFEKDLSDDGTTYAETAANAP